MDRWEDKISSCIIVSFVVSVILMWIFPLGLLLHHQYIYFLLLLLLLTLVLILYHLACFLPMTYVIDKLLLSSVGKREHMLLSILAHSVAGFLPAFILISLYNGHIVWNYLLNVPGILCGALFPVMEKWMTTDSRAEKELGQ